MSASLDSTYEGLKHESPVFRQHPHRCLDSTYEGLKLGQVRGFTLAKRGLDSTYEGLKLPQTDTRRRWLRWFGLYL